MSDNKSGINLKGFGGDLNLKQNVEGSEIDADIMKVTGSDFKGAANIEQNIKNSKVKSNLVWIIAAIGVILLGVVAHFFTKGSVEKEVKTEEAQ